MKNCSKIEPLMRRGKPFSASEAGALGVSASVLAYYCKTGKIHRLCKGVYAPAKAEPPACPEITQLAMKGSEFTVCLLSSLQLHEFTTQLPSAVWIAIPQGARLPKLSGPVHCIRLTENAYRSGVETKDVSGVKVKVYSAAKTVADCFKFRNKVGLDVALEALREGYRLKRFTVPELTAAARVCRVERVMAPYVEGILR